jgi:hypothetical protein
MRAYFFVNSWLSGIQKGLQAAHCVAEMAMNLSENDWKQLEEHAYIDWALNHKTIIILEGGSHSDLENIERVFNDQTNPYIWASFSEDEESLNNSMTCVGIIISEKLYEAAQKVREYAHDKAYVQNVRLEFPIWEVMLIDLLNSCRLAS